MNNAGYILKKLILDDGEQSIDLTGLFIDFTLYESIYDSVMTGSIAIMDSFDLKNKFVIDGDETILIEFHSSDMSDYVISFTGKVYKVGQPQSKNDHTAGYVIHFASAAMLSDSRTFVQRGYNTTHTEIVRDIVERTLDYSEKPYMSEKSKGITSLVFGSVRPIEAITIALRYAVSDRNHSAYLFYESNSAICCYPLQFLYTQEPVRDYKYTINNVVIDKSKKNIEQFERIHDIQFISEDCLYNRIVEGELGSTNLYFDIKSKQLQEFRYDTDSNFDVTKSLGKIASKKIHTNKDYTDSLSIAYNNHSQILNQQKVDNKYKKQEAYRNNILINVYGDSSIRAGDVCSVELPVYTSSPESHADFYSGKFLIASIKHMCSNTRYTQTLSLQKDAYEVAL